MSHKKAQKAQKKNLMSASHSKIILCFLCFFVANSSSYFCGGIEL